MQPTTKDEATEQYQKTSKYLLFCLDLEEVEKTKYSFINESNFLNRFSAAQRMTFFGESSTKPSISKKRILASSITLSKRLLTRKQRLIFDQLNFPEIKNDISAVKSDGPYSEANLKPGKGFFLKGNSINCFSSQSDLKKIA